MSLIILKEDCSVPSGLICPLTLSILNDPVFDPADPVGIPVEKAAFAEHQRCYSVRPLSGWPALAQPPSRPKLQRSIAAFLTTEASQQDVKGRPAKRPRTEDDPARQAAGPGTSTALGPLTTTALDIKSPVPDWLFCPLRRGIMLDLIFDPNGANWDRSAIEEHVREYGSNPITGEPLALHDLRPDLSLRPLIQKWLRENTEPLKVYTALTDEAYLGDAAAVAVNPDAASPPAPPTQLALPLDNKGDMKQSPAAAGSLAIVAAAAPPPAVHVPAPSAPPRSGSLPSAPPQSGSLPSAPPRSGSLPSAPPRSWSLPSAPPRSGSVPSAPPRSGSVPSAPPRSGSVPNPSQEALPGAPGTSGVSTGGEGPQQYHTPGQPPLGSNGGADGGSAGLPPQDVVDEGMPASQEEGMSGVGDSQELRVDVEQQAPVAGRRRSGRIGMLRGK